MRLPPLAVRASGDVDGPMGIIRKAKAKNQLTEHHVQMARAVNIAEWNLDQFWNQINPPQPFFDSGFEFALKYGCHTPQLRLLFHFHHAKAVSTASHK